ncbi:hypothetical protein [Mangrovivirga cuniculi]|uniref:Uncharacterized protein n=1 Tax=Mangrovivirga cuniculi TaxID=2715131 RepID=A0A4D7K6P3_9BACT|nr:hypothetical protein [Mangrovivirga cuniculi]QCK15068.1 hypothetical protein DCC35_10075 [Mangrovivirga cuniculi]
MKFKENNLPEEGQAVYIAGTELQPNKISIASYTDKPAESRGINEIGIVHIMKWEVFSSEEEAVNALIEKQDL